jgi:hypothetical protein
MPGGQKITVPYSTQGVSGVDVFKLGAGTTDELLPIPGTKSTAYHRPVSYPGGQKDVAYMSQLFSHHYYENNVQGIRIFKSVANYADSDLVYIRPRLAGHTSSTYYHKNYYLRVVSDSTTTQESTYNYYTLHNTKAESVSGANPVPHGTMSFNQPSHVLMKVDEMVSVRNALFDYNNDLPVFGIWPGNVYNNPDITTANSSIDGLSDNGNWRYRLCQWNFMSDIIMETAGWRQALGCSMLQNDPPYRDAGAGASTQARIMSMYGLGTINPGGFSADLNNPVMHTTNGSEAQPTDLYGNTNSWTSQHWSQFMEMPELSSGDKIKISVKVRCPDDNALREKNFGGLYFSWRYPISDSQTKHRIDYIAIKGSAVTGSQAPFTGDVTPTSGRMRDNFRVVMQGGSGYNYQTETADFKTITERASYNAEDLGSWTEVSVEIPVPDDISLSDITYSIVSNTGSDAKDVTQGWGEREGGLAYQIASNLRCGIGMFFAENGSYISSAASGQITQGDEFVPGAVYFIYNNKSGLNSSSLTQAELHDTAGTTPAAVQPSNVMKVGGTYTIETLGTMDASSDWTKVFVQNADFSTGLSVSNYIATHGGSGYDGVGFAFTVAQISGDLTGTATIRQSGYPEGFTNFKPIKNNPATHARGLFKRSSGLIQFYSPKIEYMPVA